jgi:lactoylglutathione lyase
MSSTGGRVSELRLVVTVDDYDRALRFYRDVLGLDEQATYESGGGRLTVLEAGRATIEIAEQRYAGYIDEVEVGRRVAGRFRVAFEVADARSTTDDLVAAGAELVAGPTVTPWRSLNARLEGPGPLHLTIYGPVPDGES